MRIVFFGTPDFAVATLQQIHQSHHQIVGVVTAPDKPAGRGRKLQPSAVKKYALEQGIKILQPEKLKNPEFVRQLQLLSPDIQVVVAFRMLPEVVWRLPEKGTFNIHASLLPHYRGAAPINHAIINGEKKPGLPVFFIRETIDTGAIIDKKEVLIEEKDTAGTLHDKLMMLGAQLAVETLNKISNDTIQPVEQEQLLQTKIPLKTAPKLDRAFCRINWNLPAKKVYNFIRGLSPYPAAWTLMVDEQQRTRQIKIFETSWKTQTHQLKPGTLISDERTYCKVAVKDGFIYILELRPENKKQMKIADFLRGTHNFRQWALRSDNS